MKYVKALSFYALLFFVQPVLGTVIPVLQLPNLMLCFTLMYLLLSKDEDQSHILIAGAVFSLLSDICLGQYMGVGTISLIAVVIMIFATKHYINNENRLMVILTICASSVLYNFVYWLIMSVLGSPYGFLFLLKHVLIYLAADLAVCLCIYFAVIGKIIQDRRDRYFR